MRTDYSNDTNFWDWAEVLWGCEPPFTDPVKDPSPAPLGVTIVNITPRYEEPRYPHLAHDGDFDPDQTQRIIIAWEGGKDDEPLQ